MKGICFIKIDEEIREEVWIGEKEKENIKEIVEEKEEKKDWVGMWKMGKFSFLVCNSVIGGFWVSGWDCVGLVWFINVVGVLEYLVRGCVFRIVSFYIIFL